MSELGIPFHATEVDGVPCFWADVPGPSTAGLLFRVGRSDETLASGGLTRLVQHFALLEFGGRRYEYDGQTGSTTAAFYASGAPEDLVEFLRDVGRSLRALRVDRLDSERRILGIEDERAERGVLERALMMRFGATGHGLAFYEQMGLRWLSGERVLDWAQEWFTRGNAALWMTCAPPSDLRLELPEGPRRPPGRSEAMPALELPAFAASGSVDIASTMVAPRSTAIGVGTRTVADRVHALLDVDVDAWQFPLTGGLAHRSLVVSCSGERAPEVLQGVAGIYDALAADGPTREELDAALEATTRAQADDSATAGGLDRMAVDELLGAPRRWKEDLVREAGSVSYAEVAAALREALTTQLLLAPAATVKPREHLHEFPWFSRDRVQGRELKPARRDKTGVRIVVAQEGVSHVARETGHASTVRFADIAAAIQEPDGSLTLIGLDGAIVPIDGHTFRGAGSVIGDIEGRLAPDLVVPPRDAGTLDRLARSKLRFGSPAMAALRLLGERLSHEETAVTLCEAVLGVRPGLLAVTDRRVVWLSLDPAQPAVRELSYADVQAVKLGRIPSAVVTLRSPAGEVAFSRITPKERGPEIVEEIERRTAAESQ